MAEEKLKMSCPVCGKTVGYSLPESNGTIELKCDRCRKKIRIRLDDLSSTVIQRRAFNRRNLTA